MAWKGPWPLLERRVDAAALASGLAAAGIARESERLAALDADIRERAFFNRRLKAAEQERERDRQRQIAEQQALDEEKRKALEAARREQTWDGVVEAPPAVPAGFRSTTVALTATPGARRSLPPTTT